MSLTPVSVLTSWLWHLNLQLANKLAFGSICSTAEHVTPTGRSCLLLCVLTAVQNTCLAVCASSHLEDSVPLFTSRWSVTIFHPTMRFLKDKHISKCQSMKWAHMDCALEEPEIKPVEGELTRMKPEDLKRRSPMGAKVRCESDLDSVADLPKDCITRQWGVCRAREGIEGPMRQCEIVLNGLWGCLRSFVSFGTGPLRVSGTMCSIPNWDSSSVVVQWESHTGRDLFLFNCYWSWVWHSLRLVHLQTVASFIGSYSRQSSGEAAQVWKRCCVPSRGHWTPVLQRRWVTQLKVTKCAYIRHNLSPEVGPWAQTQICHSRTSAPPWTSAAVFLSLETRFRRITVWVHSQCKTLENRVVFLGSKLFPEDILCRVTPRRVLFEQGNVII